mmetsp:Transcript_63584/g.174589  ORF Transcript_63584/g.174589 Transcript_63584/m.174589 type:complete len:306 (-) Transcript_63584:309-1226(-)
MSRLIERSLNTFTTPSPPSATPRWRCLRSPLSSPRRRRLSPAAAASPPGRRSGPGLHRGARDSPPLRESAAARGATCPRRCRKAVRHHRRRRRRRSTLQGRARALRRRRCSRLAQAAPPPRASRVTRRFHRSSTHGRNHRNLPKGASLVTRWQKGCAASLRDNDKTRCFHDSIRSVRATVRAQSGVCAAHRSASAAARRRGHRGRASAPAPHPRGSRSSRGRSWTNSESHRRRCRRRGILDRRCGGGTGCRECAPRPPARPLRTRGPTERARAPPHAPLAQNRRRRRHRFSVAARPRRQRMRPSR